MLHLSIHSALELWDKLHSALKKIDGDICEIYYHDFMVNYLQNPQHMAVALHNLRELCDIFQSKHNCTIIFEDEDDYRRIHVRVTKNTP